MAFVDYYKILGVDKNIPQKDVRAAYRKRAKQFHPDLHPNDPKAKAKFQALNEAYDVISDPDKRAKYDQYGEQWKNAQAYEQAGGGFGGFGGGGAGGGNPFEGFDFSNFGSGGSGFSSFFENLFGGRGAGGAGGFGGFGGFGGYQQSRQDANDEDSLRLNAAANYINSRHFTEAMNVLNGITSHSARWHYLNAAANAGLGNNIEAKAHAREAVNMEPNNVQYRNFLNQMEMGGAWYQSMGQSYGRPMGGSDDFCMKLCIANMLCNCCCGGRFTMC